MDRSFKPALILMVGRALAFVGTFFMPLVLVRVFDQAEFGTYKQLFLVYCTLFLVAQCGMAESLIYFLPLSVRRAPVYVANAALFLGGLGLVSGVGLALAGPLVARALRNPALATEMPLLGAFLGLTLASALLEMVMIARGQYLWASVAYGASDLLRAAFFIVPALFARTLHAVFWGACAFAALRLCAALLSLHREFPGALRPEWAALRSQLAYAVPFGAAVILEIVQNNYHQYAVSYAFDAATFAVYSVGCLNIPIVDFVSSPASNVMMVRMSEALRDGRRDEAVAVWHGTVRKVILVFAPLVGVLLVTGRDLIVSLFTVRYEASVPVFLVWTPAILWTAVMVDGVLRVYADTRFLLGLNALRLALNVVLMAPFLRRFHVMGAVLVALFATTVTRLVALARIARLMELPLPRLLPFGEIGKILLVATLAAAPALGLSAGASAPPPVRALLAGALYALSFAALALPLGLVPEGERRALAAWFRRRPSEAPAVGRVA